MKLLLLAEGDAERWEAWSGSSKSLVDHLRGAGHDVATGDVDLYGIGRGVAAALAFSPQRKRWAVRYHLMAPAYRWRSWRAARLVARHAGRLDCIIQIGATFDPPRRRLPYAVFCDSNIAMAEEGATYGVSDAAWLRRDELDALRRREGRIYRGACVVFTISDYLRRSFIEAFALPTERVCTVGAGPNLDPRRVPLPRPRPRDGAPTILFVGKQFERKGGAILLEAFRIVRQQMPQARLVIVGPAAPPTAEPGVEWTGHLDKNEPAQWARLAHAYQDADVFCLPSLFEPFGIVFVEAMFFGLPCVGTAEWAIPEMIIDGHTGYTVPRAHVMVLADRLVALLTDRSRAHEMGLAGRRHAERRFTWSAVTERMISRLESCRLSSVPS